MKKQINRLKKLLIVIVCIIGGTYIPYYTGYWALNEDGRTDPITLILTWLIGLMTVILFSLVGAILITILITMVCHVYYFIIDEK